MKYLIRRKILDLKQRVKNNNNNEILYVINNYLLQFLQFFFLQRNVCGTWIGVLSNFTIIIYDLISFIN